jgi:hypothetical protein
MKKIPLYLLVLVLWSGRASAQDGISISLSSNDPRAEMGPRYDARDARVAIRTRDRSTMLLLLDDTIAVQLSDSVLAKIESEKKKKDTSFFEELVLAGVRIAVGQVGGVPDFRYPQRRVPRWSVKDRERSEQAGVHGAEGERDGDSAGFLERGCGAVCDCVSGAENALNYPPSQ